MTDSTFAGLRHQCDDKDCHVPAYQDTLRRMLDTQREDERRKGWEQAATAAWGEDSSAWPVSYEDTP